VTNVASFRNKVQTSNRFVVLVYKKKAVVDEQTLIRICIS